MDKLFPKGEHPEITAGLLQYLDDLFPLSAFMSAASMEDVCRHKGARDVIDHLRSLYISDQKE